MKFKLQYFSCINNVQGQIFQFLIWYLLFIFSKISVLLRFFVFVMVQIWILLISTPVAKSLFWNCCPVLVYFRALVFWIGGPLLGTVVIFCSVLDFGAMIFWNWVQLLSFNSPQFSVIVPACAYTWMISLTSWVY